MAKQKNKLWKIIVFDILAGLCFIGVILFGWLPGPGGIPLFLLGLSLLAANHDWAERWLETAKHRGVSFKKWIFPNIRWVQNLYDLFAVSFIIVGGFILVTYDNRYIQGIMVAIIVFSMFMFLMNRDRFDSFGKLYKRFIKKDISINKSY